MKCPECANEYVCPCTHCVERFPDKIPWIKTNITEITYDETCPKCGIIKDVHDWMDIEYEQYKALETK